MRFLALVFCQHLRVALTPLLQLSSDDDDDDEGEADVEEEEEGEEVVIVVVLEDFLGRGS